MDRIVLVLILSLMLGNVFASEVKHKDASTTSHSNHQHQARHRHGHTLRIDEDTKQLLREEMQFLKQSMADLIGAMAEGDWDRIASLAKGMQSKNIFKQKLSQEQINQLHHSLPRSFQHKDHRFHYYAGMLSHVALERDQELVGFYVYKMQESCMSCHKKFAYERFPGFTEPNKHEHKHGEHSHH